MGTTGYDAATGRPLHGRDEAVETLSNNELEAELTIASLYAAVGRAERYDRLWGELLNRRRGYSTRGVGLPA